MKYPISFLAFSLALSGCAPINGLPTNQGQLGAPITQAQKEKIKASLAIKTNNSAINKAILEASNVIANFTQAESCINNYRDSSLEKYTAPGGRMNTSYAPIMSMQYHDRSKCLSVVRFQGWSMPAKNSLKFEVIYISDGSGASKKRFHEVVKQPSGEWLFTPET